MIDGTTLLINLQSVTLKFHGTIQEETAHCIDMILWNQITIISFE